SWWSISTCPRWRPPACRCRCSGTDPPRCATVGEGTRPTAAPAGRRRQPAGPLSGPDVLSCPGALSCRPEPWRTLAGVTNSVLLPSRTSRRAVPSVLLALVAALMLALALAPPPAHAHDTLIATDPEDGTTLETSPEQIT